MSLDRTSSSRAGAEAESSGLVRDCLENRPGAWEEFLRRYSNLVYSTILRVGLPLSDQEEAYQAAIVGIYRQLGGLRDTDRLIPWIVGISYRQAINRIRSRRKETSLEELSEADLAAAGSGLASAPEDELVALERAQQANETLAHLSERCRRLIQLLFYESPPPEYAEISRRENIPIGSIGPTRARCLEKARRIFEERGWV